MFFGANLSYPGPYSSATSYSGSPGSSPNPPKSCWFGSSASGSLSGTISPPACSGFSPPGFGISGFEPSGFAVKPSLFSAGGAYGLSGCSSSGGTYFGGLR